MAYLTGSRTPWRAPVPVVVVGNVAVGGTGKTPLVVWLVGWLAGRGFRPGIVSRGYGGRRGERPLLVNANTDPDLAGDEAPLLAARTGVPVVVCADRVQAVQHLLEHRHCDLIVADDGLQHYALARDVEIAVVDGSRGLGNRRCLPAGPLREPPERLGEVDLVVVNGAATGEWQEACAMAVAPRSFVRLDSGERLDVDEFAVRYGDVHAVAGIGNPGRFAETLAQLGLRALLHAYPDHHRYEGDEVRFDDAWPVVCTEKDAVKLRRLNPVPGNCWYLEIDVVLSEEAEQRIAGVLRKHGIATS